MTKHFLFLDFDGVINTHRSLFKGFADHYGVSYTEDDFSFKYKDCGDGINPDLMSRIEKAIDSGEHGKYNITTSSSFPFDDICIKHCNKIIKENNAEICVISTWRIGKDIKGLQTLLDEIGIIGRVIGITGNSSDRGAEIYEWVRDYQKKYERVIDSICIIDDDHAYDIDYIFLDYTVKNIKSIRHGLKEHHIAEAKCVFNKTFSLKNIK